MKKKKDKCFKHFNILMSMVEKEHNYQIQKWGVQSRTPFEWMTYITEEVGELANAVSENVYRNGNNNDVVKEAIQTATLCLKVAEMYIEPDIKFVNKVLAKAKKL